MRRHELKLAFLPVSLNPFRPKPAQSFPKVPRNDMRLDIHQSYFASDSDLKVTIIPNPLHVRKKQNRMHKSSTPVESIPSHILHLQQLGTALAHILPLDLECKPHFFGLKAERIASFIGLFVPFTPWGQARRFLGLRGPVDIHEVGVVFGAGAVVAV